MDLLVLKTPHADKPFNTGANGLSGWVYCCLSAKRRRRRFYEVPGTK
jgi:hypothetical protein